MKGTAKNRHQAFVADLPTKEIEMSPSKHSSSSQVLCAVGVMPLLMLFASCGGSDSIGALSSDAGSSKLADLCKSTGGTVTQHMCCNGSADFADVCGALACNCSAQSSHYVNSCICPGPSPSCFDPTLGCIPAGGGGASGSGGAIGSGGIVATGGVPATGGATIGAGGSGSGGQARLDADVKTDSNLHADASALERLCTSTGGQPKTQDCCGTVGDYPDMCSIGACACSPSGSHSVTVCSCQNMGCFSPTAGCNLGVGGSGGSTGSRADATTLADLCQSTGGHLASQQACLAVTEFPNTCLEAACSPANSHTVTGCACPTGACFSPDVGCGPLSAGTGGIVGSGGASGKGGAGGNIVVKLDAPISTDATALADLCMATGGTIESKSCCASASDFPDSCMGGACGCAPEYSHDIPVCTCPTGTCFSYSLGCAPRDAGSA